MSLLGKLFGGRSLDDERAHADQLFAQGQFGPAKLAYERAATLAKDAPDARAALTGKVTVCRNAIAKAHMEEAERLLKQGSVELAREELQSVTETADDANLLRAAEERMERLERAVVRAELAHDAPSDEDRFELIAGGFEEDQYSEYLAHGEACKHALLQLHDGETRQARSALEELLTSADGPRYLWFELGRARLAEGDNEGGSAALEQFLASLHAEEGGDARLLAHMELAQLLHARGDFDAAVAHYEAALTAMPDDPRPYLAMANFFRREKLPEEAIEVAEAGLEALEGHHPPDIRLWQEIGLAHADAGRQTEAKGWLERVVAHLSNQRLTDLPPESTLRLAQIYEQTGAPSRALDLYSLLAAGSDRPNLHQYHIEAARLMQTLDLKNDARRMLQRARELAPDDAQARITEALAALDAAGTAPSNTPS